MSWESEGDGPDEEPCPCPEDKRVTRKDLDRSDALTRGLGVEDPFKEDE